MAPGEGALIFEMITKDWEHYISLVDKVAARFERIDSNFERIVGKCYQTALHVTEKSFVKGRVSWCGTLHCGLILKEIVTITPHSLPQKPPPWSINSH